ncbi:MAG: hypothetical protein DRJ47_01710 [Thermoprotei archaeon]|nr:MAG: hypothetical protein DRJ47_01710 [Thermoprotei archaeon]
MGTLRNGGMSIGLVAQPLLLRWDGYRCEPKKAMNTQRMKTLEARIPRLSRGSVKGYKDSFPVFSGHRQSSQNIFYGLANIKTGSRYADHNS